MATSEGGTKIHKGNIQYSLTVTICFGESREGIGMQDRVSRSEKKIKKQMLNFEMTRCLFSFFLS